MKYVLAIDAGGTKCEALLAREDGIQTGRGRCDYSHPTSGRGIGGSGRSEHNVRSAVAAAFAGHPAIDELHVVGHGLPHDTLAEGQVRRLQFRRCSEPDAALALADSDSGVVALAGTGAFVYGRRPDGEHLLLDALGPLLGDHGSAYHIGLLAVRAAAKASWHPRHHTSLGTVIPAACAQHVGRPGRFSMVEYMLGPRDRSEIASLAELVDREAESGDGIARQILEEAAADLAETLRDVVDRLGIAHEPLPLVATGSVATRSRIYWVHFSRIAAEVAPGLRPVVPAHPQVVGIALKGLKEIGAPAEARDNLLCSAAA